VELARGLNTFLQSWARSTMNEPIYFEQDTSAQDQIHAAAQNFIDSSNDMDMQLHGHAQPSKGSGFYAELLEAINKTQSETLAKAESAELKAMALQEELKALSSHPTDHQVSGAARHQPGFGMPPEKLEPWRVLEVLGVSAGWVSPSSRGLWGGDALLL
jgi:hypothetical protein